MYLVKRLEESISSITTKVNEIKDNKVVLGFQPDHQQVTAEYINDSFLIGMPVNGIMYDADEALILDDFE